MVVEGPLLDYKIDFPNDLARTIAAMANTLGGIILVGVDEQTDGKPALPIAGVPLQPGLAEKVTNIVLDNLTPPVFPEVAVCPDSSSTKAVVIIRVPQSPESESRKAAMAALKTIAWAYNWDVSEKLIDAYYIKERRR